LVYSVFHDDHEKSNAWFYKNGAPPQAALRAAGAPL